MKTELAVGGMTCGACTAAVTQALEAVPGVNSVDVSLVTERAVVDHSADDASPPALVAAVEDVGFEAQVIGSKDLEQEKTTTNIKVGGMTCGACTSAVTKALEHVAGVTKVSVSLITDTAVVQHTLGSEGVAQLLTAVEDAGFDAVLGDTREVQLRIFGVDPDETEVEKSLRDIDGVVACRIENYIASVVYDPRITNVRALVGAVEAAGCYAVLAASADNTQQVAALERVQETMAFRRDTVLCFSLGIPIFVLSKLRKHMPSFLTARVIPGLWVDDILSLLLVLPIMFKVNRRFYHKSWKAVRARAPTMDVLVTLSSSAAFIYSVVALLRSIVIGLDHHQMYLWEACAMISSFVVLGKFLENKARGRTSRALSALIALVPETALLAKADGSKEEVPTDMLEVGDRIVLRPGEKVCADGVVVSGESYINEAMLTGEHTPVFKRISDQVIGGTINGTGALEFDVTSCGNDTKLAQIVRLVKDAQAGRAPIQRFADVAAAKFVPVVLLLALVTFVGWFVASAVMHDPPAIFQHSRFFVCLRMCISVVVVACPCALGLATPTAVMVGTGVGAEHGILIKSGGAFEQLSGVNVVLFDKTGTLTTGNIRVVSTTVSSQLWPLVQALERRSEHPVGKALAEYGTDTESEKLDVTDFKVHMGEGVSGYVTGRFVEVRTGSEAGQVEVSVDSQIVGTVTLRDSLRSDSAAVVELLKADGYTVGVVSGDAAATVEAIAADVGIDPSHAWSRMHPQDKVRVIEDLQSQGMSVAFVGDGINDSLALSAATVGISIEGATHVAVESADVVLVQRSPIRAVPAAVALAKATMGRIKLNLAAAVVYNALAIPFAMGLLLPFGMTLSPTAASAAMASSSVSVVVSSLSLKGWKPPDPDIPVKDSWFRRVLQHLRPSSRQPRYEPVPV